MDRLAGGKSQRPGRGGGRAQRAQSMGGGPWPPPCFGFAGQRPAKRRRPAGAHQRQPATPRQRASVGPVAVAHGKREGWSGQAGGGGWARSALKERARGQRPRARSFVWQAEEAAPRAAPSAGQRRRRSVRRGVCRARRRSGAGAIGPGPGTCPLPGLPGSGRVGFAHPPPPPLRWGFRQRQKGNAKARPFDQPSHAPSTARKKAVATASRAVRNGACASCAGGRCPRFYGSSPGDRRSADRTYRKGTGGLPAFQRGKGRY